MKEEVLEKASGIAAKAVGFGTGLGTLFEFLSKNAAAIGVLVAIATMLVNLHYTRKRDKREERELQMRVRK